MEVDLAEYEGLHLLKDAMEGGDPCQSFIMLLQALMEKGLPAHVELHENENSPSPSSFNVGRPFSACSSRVPAHRMIFLLGGTYRVINELEDRQMDRVLNVGELYWIKPDGWYLVRNDEPRSVLSVTFYEGFTRFLWYYRSNRSVDGKPSPAPEMLPYHTHSSPSQELWQSIALLDNAIGVSRDVPPSVLNSTAQTVLAWCLRELKADVSLAKAGAEAKTIDHSKRNFEEIRAWVTEHLHDDLDRAQVAEIFRISEDHLTRLFRVYAKCGFVTFIRTERLRLAEHLLRESRLSVKEVAAASGFNLSAYFIKRFREKYGVTPAVWRSNARGEGMAESLK